MSNVDDTQGLDQSNVDSTNKLAEPYEHIDFVGK